MPQLNPAPWLWVMLSTWIIIIMVLVPKILTMHYINPPKLTCMALQPNPWMWPWL